jgi:hypothetical protein
MKIWLDDLRPIPDTSWICGVGNGYDVLLFVEKMLVINPSFLPPSEIRIHTANPVAKKRMLQARESVDKFRHKV